MLIICEVFTSTEKVTKYTFNKSWAGFLQPGNHCKNNGNNYYRQNILIKLI